MAQQQQPLQIGTYVSVRALNNLEGEPHTTRVEGISDDSVVLQRTEDQDSFQLSRGMGVELSFTVADAHGMAGKYSAESVILAVASEPVPMLRVQLPEEWERTQLRKFFRVPATRPGRVRTLPAENDEGWMEALTRDVSGGGCQLLLPEMLESGQLVEVELHLPDSIVRTRGTVQRMQEDTSLRGFVGVAGIQFTNISETQRDELIRYAFDRQIELRRQKKGMA